ncbi:MAG TPA: response regulator [Acidimicrobiales bacterium]|nr:response regulator [Acidimicrobiales bacterium]
MAVTWAVDEDDVNDGEAAHAPPNQRRSESGDAIGEAAQSVEAAGPHPLSVLVAEDEAALRQSLSAILEGAGHRVVEAEDGQVALGLLQEQTFDVLVLDLHMPNLDGMDVLRQIEVPPPVVIVYSAFAYYSPDALRDELGVKVFRYLQKPVPPLELIAAVNEAAELDR